MASSEERVSAQREAASHCIERPLVGCPLRRGGDATHQCPRADPPQEGCDSVVRHADLMSFARCLFVAEDCLLTLVAFFKYSVDSIHWSSVNLTFTRDAVVGRELLAVCGRELLGLIVGRDDSRNADVGREGLLLPYAELGLTVRGAKERTAR